MRTFNVSFVGLVIAFIITVFTLTSCENYEDEYLAAQDEIAALKSNISDLIAQGDADAAQIAELLASETELKSTLATLENDLIEQELLTDEAKQALDAANAQIESLEAEILDLQSSIEDLNTKLANSEITAAEYQEQIADLEAELADAEAQVVVVTEEVEVVVTEIVTETQVVTEVVNTEVIVNCNTKWILNDWSLDVDADLQDFATALGKYEATPGTYTFKRNDADCNEQTLTITVENTTSVKYYAEYPEGYGANWTQITYEGNVYKFDDYDYNDDDDKFDLAKVTDPERTFTWSKDDSEHASGGPDIEEIIVNDFLHYEINLTVNGTVYNFDEDGGEITGITADCGKTLKAWSYDGLSANGYKIDVTTDGKLKVTVDKSKIQVRIFEFNNTLDSYIFSEDAKSYTWNGYDISALAELAVMVASDTDNTLDLDAPIIDQCDNEIDVTITQTSTYTDCADDDYHSETVNLTISADGFEDFSTSWAGHGCQLKS